MNITIAGLKKYAFAMPIVGISIVGSNFIQSIGKAKIAMVLGLLRQVIILIPMVIILPNFFGLNGVWFAQPTADIVSAVITGIVLIKEIKKNFSDNMEKSLEEARAM